MNFWPTLHLFVIKFWSLLNIRFDNVDDDDDTVD